MLYLVTGGSSSGKSEYGENLAARLYREEKGDGRLYYVAAMYPHDEECRKKIKKHRQMRKGKGFQTLECCHHLERVKGGPGDVFLIECLSNLLANEMYFAEGQIKRRDKELLPQTEKAVLKPVLHLLESGARVVVMTNEVFGEGMDGDHEIKCYQEALGWLNQQLGKRAEQVIEVVCSIPVWVKGEDLCGTHF